MISKETILEFSSKFQTEEHNITREYAQHLFLSHLYQKKGAERLLFKGGTALRFIFKSPRFSEDLDFTGIKIDLKGIKDLFLETILAIEKTGVDVVLNEAKPTTGGYLGKIIYNSPDFSNEIKIEISFRNLRSKILGDMTLIDNDFIPPYVVFHLPEKELALGKVNALLSRAKPRDFYDFYFLLRKSVSVIKRRETLEKVLEKLENSTLNFRQELGRLLPRSHHMILKDFKSILTREIKKYL